MTARTLAAPFAPTERDLTAQVLQLAHMYGWLTAHFRPARRADGTWATPLQGDGAGFPDLVLVRPPRLIVAELKTDRGRLSSLQTRWLDALRAVAGIEVYVWRPDDLTGAVHAALRWDDA